MASPLKLPPGATLVDDGSQNQNSQMKLPPGATLVDDGSGSSPIDLPGSRPELRDAVAANPALQQSAQPTKFEQERNPATQKDGFWSSFGKDLRGFLTPAGQMPGAYPNVQYQPPSPGRESMFSEGPDLKGQAAQEAVAQDDARKASGRGVIYRAMAPVAEAVGVNVPGMEQAADVGNSKAILGHAAAPATAAVAAYGAPKISGVLSKAMKPVIERASAPLSDTVTSPRGTVPAESATPADLKAYADQNGIPINAAQATEHNLPRGIQATGERSLIGGTGIKKQIKTAQGAISDHVSNLMDNMAAASETPNTAASGDALKSNIGQALDREKIQADHNFSAIDQQANGIGVDAKPLKQLAGQISQDSAFTREKTPSMNPLRATKIVRDVQGLPDQISFKDAQSLRSDLLEEARHPDNAISEKAQGWIKQLSGQTDQSMMDAAAQKPGLEKAFRQANDHWKGLHEDFNSPRSALYQALKEPVPERVPQKFLQRGSTGGAPSVIQKLQQYGIDTGPLKRELLGDIANSDFKLHQGKNLGGYTDEFLKSVFTPEELDHVYKTGAIARSVGWDANPSRTATVESQAQQVEKPVRSLLPKSGAAGITKSQGWNDYFMKSRPGEIARAMTQPSGRTMRGLIRVSMASQRGNQR